MSYRVFWSPYAEELLERILRESVNSVEAATAARDINRFLTSNPIDFGESRDDTVRIGFHRPLAVQYDVLEDVARLSSTSSGEPTASGIDDVVGLRVLTATNP